MRAIETIRQLATESGENVHIRVLGDAGIGKTRLVLEATRTETIIDDVFYFSSYERLSTSPLVSFLANNTDHGAVILVCDECDASGARDIWNQLANAGTDLVIVSISNEKDVSTSTDRVHQVDAPALGAEQIQKIFDEKEVPLDVSSHYIEFCEGSPRWADLIATNLVSESPDPLKMDDELSIVVERAIAGRDKTTSEVGRNRITVAEFLSLSRKFGYQGALAEEGRSIGRLISAKTANISEVEFAQAIDGLRSHRILQGESTLYLSPRPLHVALWKKWWDSYEQIFDYEEFSGYFTGSLSTWFEEMFVYANNSRAADRVIERLFDDDGTFADKEALRDPRKAELFLVLAGVKPALALEHVERFVSDQISDELRNFVSGRRQAIWALEKIAVWRDLFPRASQVLLKLAVAENESISNNASGVFSGLFAIGQGQVANTESSATERLVVLKSALQSEDPEIRKKGLSAAESLLRTRGHFRMIGPEHQAFGRIPQLWQPKIGGDLLDPWKTVWTLLDTKRNEWSGEEKQNAADILLRSTRDFAQIESLAPLVVTSIESMILDASLDYRRVIETIEETLRYDRESLSKDVYESLSAIRDGAVGTSFNARLRRFVGVSLIEDNYDSEGNRTGQTDSIIAELAGLVADDPGILKPELDWLFGKNVDNAFAFGYQLGAIDDSKTIFKIILESLKENEQASPVLVSGYLRNVRENATLGEFVNILLEDIHRRGMARYVPEIIWRSGELTDGLGQLVLDNLEEADLPPEHLRMFKYGGVSSGLSVPAFESWLTYLADSQSDEAIITAVELAAMYLHRRPAERILSDVILQRILTSPTWFRERDRMSWGGGVDRDWATVAGVLVRDHPDGTDELASVVVSNFGIDSTAIAAGIQATARLADDC